MGTLGGGECEDGAGPLKGLGGQVPGRAAAEPSAPRSPLTMAHMGSRKRSRSRSRSRGRGAKKKRKKDSSSGSRSRAECTSVAGKDPWGRGPGEQLESGPGVAPCSCLFFSSFSFLQTPREKQAQGRAETTPRLVLLQLVHLFQLIQLVVLLFLVLLFLEPGPEEAGEAQEEEEEEEEEEAAEEVGGAVGRGPAWALAGPVAPCGWGWPRYGAAWPVGRRCRLPAQGAPNSLSLPAVLTDEQKSRIQAMKPMTKEEWDARQSVIRRVLDPETGRTR